SDVHSCLLRLSLSACLLFSSFTAAAPTDIYTLSLHDALPIFAFVDLHKEITMRGLALISLLLAAGAALAEPHTLTLSVGSHELQDRKSTRLNSSHVKISYAVFCLKKKKRKEHKHHKILSS